MHYTGMIYRPPFEANSLLLQVTVGCSHNSCSFCTMYRDVPYQVSPMEEIEEDLQEASLYVRNITRVFLEGGDAFTLPGERLIEIAERIHYYLPRVKTIAMYANISNIRTKTDEELARMHELKIDELNVGLESGDDEVLRYMNKGYDSKFLSEHCILIRVVRCMMTCRVASLRNIPFENIWRRRLFS